MKAVKGKIRTISQRFLILVCGLFILGERGGGGSCAWGAKLTTQEYYREGQSYQRNIVEKPALDPSIDLAKQNIKIPKYSKNPETLKRQGFEKLQMAQTTNDPGAQAGQLAKSSPSGLVIDPKTDPLLLDGEEIGQNPEKFLGVDEEPIEIGGQGGPGEEKIERHICHEGESSTVEKCQARLVPRVTNNGEERKEHLINLLGKDMYSSGFISISKRNPRRPADADAKNIEVFRAKGKLVDAKSGQVLDIDLNKLADVSVVKSHGPMVTYFYEKKKHSSSKAKGHKYVQYKLTTLVKTPTYEYDTWESDCGDLEHRTDQGICEAIDKRCIDPEKTKIIDGVSHTADCWREERVYQCSRKVTDSCQALRDRGCYQVLSKCVARDKNTDFPVDARPCIQWEQTFECATGGVKKTMRLKGPAPFCLDGNCHEVAWAANTDMADSLSKLSVLNAMKTDTDKDKITVFQGKKLKCSRNPAGFKNCCVKKGWGMKIGLADCDKDEKELAVERAGNKCVMVGTYCKTKQLGVCIDKRTSYCCFGTKLSRILHEQGRKLLGMDFGTAKHPNCSGFKITDFAKLDMSKIDLSELFQELLSKMKVPDAKEKGAKMESKLDTPEKQEEFRRNQERMLKEKDKKGEL